MSFIEEEVCKNKYMGKVCLILIPDVESICEIGRGVFRVPDINTVSIIIESSVIMSYHHRISQP